MGESTIFGRMMCFLFGEHIWGQWGYLDDSTCAQQRLCTRCGVPSQVRVVHTALQWMPNPVLPCVEEIKCARDGAILDRREMHVWNEWALCSESPERYSRTCGICGFKEDRCEDDPPYIAQSEDVPRPNC